MMLVAWPVCDARRDRAHRPPASAGVVLRDPDQQERHCEADESRQVEVGEAEGGAVEGHRDRDEPDRGQDDRDEHALVERVHDRSALPHAGEERSDDRGEDRDRADRQRVLVELAAGEASDRDQHHGDGGDGVRLEEVGSHAGAVADVVADVVGDDSRVARVVLGDPGLDLADQVGADVGRLRVDPAAETREDGDQRAAEREADEIVDRGARAVVEQVGEHPVVAGDAEQAEPDDEEPGDRAGTEGDVESRLQTALRSLCGPHVRADGDVHPDEAGGRRQHCPDEEADRRAPAELAVEPDQQEGDDRDEPDRPVLPVQVGGGPFLHCARDLPHAFGARRLPEEPDGQADSVRDRGGCADERKENRVLFEEVQRCLPLVYTAPRPARRADLSNTPGPRRV